MPSLIGKHIQVMNTNTYESIESIVNLYWPTVWDKRLLYADNQEEILSFLSALNGIVAKKLIDQVDEYNLLEKIKQDMMALYEKEQEPWFHWFSSTKEMLLSNDDSWSATEQEPNFLRQHVTDIRTSLLMELHIQFMDFFTRIQSDIIEQFLIDYQD